MKTRFFALFLGLLLVSAVARAESITGTITDVDSSGQRITLLRADTNESITVHVKDRGALDNLRMGTQVSFDGDKRMTGAWETQSVTPSTASSSRSSASAADLSRNSRTTSVGPSSSVALNSIPPSSINTPNSTMAASGTSSDMSAGTAPGSSASPSGSSSASSSSASPASSR